jgi:hypothetical protein
MISITNSSTGATQLVVSDKISDRVIPPSSATLPLNPNTLFNPATNYITGSAASTSIAYGFLSSGQYFENSACTTTGNSCVANTNTYPSATSCSCPDNTVTPPSTRPCSIQGCEWAFELTNPGSSVTTSYLGYTDGINQYLLSDGYGYGERGLNSLEQGLCADIVQPSCTTITTPGVNDGGATWPTANVGQTVNGTCLSGSKTANGKAPTRNCMFQDDGTYQSNGCPNSGGIAFSSVTNACNASVPTWWPSEFLYANNKFQGAIINQFNVRPDYMSKVVPRAANVNPLKANGNSAVLVSPGKTEPWVASPSSSNSCKDSYSINVDLAPRSYTDSDQEMLFITQANWRNIWNYDFDGDGILNDLTWLLAASDKNNGCYVYNVNNYLNATISKATAGLKICKSGNKVSFSLVDLSVNSSKSYTNNAYMMQSNIIAYDQISTASAGYDNSLPAKTNVTNSAGGATYQLFINHGFVINTTGFNNTSSTALARNTPIGFVSINTPESVEVDYALTGIYDYSTSKGNYTRYTNYTSSGGQNYQGDFSPADPVQISTCALAVYRKGVNYSSSVSSLDYFAIPSTLNYSSGSRTYPSSYSIPYISSLYLYTTYNGGNSGSSWPRQNNCYMDIAVKNYVAGNSAINPSMFLWSSPTNYNVCNQ